VGVPSDVAEVLAAMTHGSATVPDPLHPLYRHDVGAYELPLPRELEPVAFAMRLAVVIRVVGDVRRGGEGPDRAAS
jgi:hypothetical protein